MKKKFAIFSKTTDGHRQLHAETNLLSEAKHFERLGYVVVPSREAGIAA